jgi:hypothetical protein
MIALVFLQEATPLRFSPKLEFWLHGTKTTHFDSCGLNRVFQIIDRKFQAVLRPFATFVLSFYI